MSDWKPSGVRVKPLVWVQCQSTLPRVVFEAKSCFGRYVTWPNGNWKLYGVYGYEQEGDLNSAKAGAEADYETRILSALEPDQPDPVGYALERILKERGRVFDAMVDAAEDAAGKDVSFNVVVGRAIRAALAAVEVKP